MTSVLFLHGVDSDRTVWDASLEALDDTYTTVAIDFPGHGQADAPSDPNAYTREAVLSDIDDALAELEPNPIVVGHSLGGYLALAHVITRPRVIGGLVLVATGPGFRNEDARQQWNDRVDANTPSYGISPVAATIAYHHDSLVMDRLSEVTVPTALVIGSRDKAFAGANDYLEKKLGSHCVLRVTVEGAGHFVMTSNPESVVSAVAEVASHIGN